VTPVADCLDCAWRTTAEDLVEAGDEADRHERKEMHDVEVKRTVTDGAGEPWIADCDGCEFRVVVEEPSVTSTIEERAKMAAGGHRSSYPDHDVNVNPVDDSGAKVHKCDICDTRFTSVVELINHDCDDHQEGATLVPDGGTARQQAQGTAAQLAGVADQDTTCEHGSEGCPGPEGNWMATCLDCFYAGGEDGE